MVLWEKITKLTEQGKLAVYVLRLEEDLGLCEDVIEVATSILNLWSYFFIWKELFQQKISLLNKLLELFVPF